MWSHPPSQEASLFNFDKRLDSILEGGRLDFYLEWTSTVSDAVFSKVKVSHYLSKSQITVHREDQIQTSETSSHSWQFNINCQGKKATTLQQA